MSANGRPPQPAPWTPPNAGTTPNAERYLLEADALRRRQLHSALLHGSSRTWRDRRRIWPAMVAGAVVVAVIVAVFVVIHAIEAEQDRQQEEQQQGTTSTLMPGSRDGAPVAAAEQKHAAPAVAGIAVGTV